MPGMVSSGDTYLVRTITDVIVAALVTRVVKKESLAQLTSFGSSIIIVSPIRMVGRGVPGYFDERRIISLRL